MCDFETVSMGSNLARTGGMHACSGIFLDIGRSAKGVSAADDQAGSGGGEALRAAAWRDARCSMIEYE